jgi:hypothetical protein
MNSAKLSGRMTSNRSSLDGSRTGLSKRRSQMLNSKFSAKSERDDNIEEKIKEIKTEIDLLTHKIQKMD